MSPAKLKVGGSGCGCSAQVNELIAKQNQRLITTLFGGVTVVETEKLDLERRGRPPKLLASYCPFCGVKYPDDDRAFAASAPEKSKAKRVVTPKRRRAR